MRRWFLVSLATIAVLVPGTSRATVRPRIPLATGAGSVTMLESDQPTSVYQYRYYTLRGTFTVGKKIYIGTITGQWSQDLYSRGGEFSGYNGKHSFTASNCGFLAGLPDHSFDLLPVGGPTPSGRSEVYRCSADIDGTDQATLVLDFVYRQMFPSGQPCCLWGWKGVFIGI